MRKPQVRLKKEGRIGTLDSQLEIYVADVGDERGISDWVSEHCNLLTDVVTFNHYMAVTVTCQVILPVNRPAPTKKC